MERSGAGLQSKGMVNSDNANVENCWSGCPRPLLPLTTLYIFEYLIKLVEVQLPVFQITEIIVKGSSFKVVRKFVKEGS